MMGIYKITSPTGRIYIGQSIDCEKRKRGYSNYFCKGQPLLFRSLKKYGWDSHAFEVIEVCASVDEMNEREKYYISFYDSTNTTTGMNLQKGGLNGLHSDATKKLMSERAKGRIMTNEVRSKVSKSKKGKQSSFKGKAHTEEARKKQSAAHTGKVLSAETRSRMSASRTGVKRPQHGARISEIQKGRVLSEDTKQKIREKALLRHKKTT